MKHFKIALLCLAIAVVSFVAGTLFHQLQPLFAPDDNPEERGRFKATTRFIIQPTGAPQESRDASASGNEAWLKDQLGVIMSKEVLRRAVKRLNLESEWKLPAPDAVEKLKRKIEVEREEGTNIVRLTAWSKNIVEAPSLANAVCEAYGNFRIETDLEAFNHAAGNTMAQINKQADQIHEAEARLEATQKGQQTPDSREPKSTSPPAGENAQQSESVEAKKLHASALQLLFETREALKQHAGSIATNKMPIVIIEFAAPPTP